MTNTIVRDSQRKRGKLTTQFSGDYGSPPGGQGWGEVRCKKKRQ